MLGAAAMETWDMIISGEVQGVAYRSFARRMATGLGITGWARNLENGDVEIRATGNKKALLAFLDYCKKGSSPAIVRRISVKKLDAVEEFGGFSAVYG
jgi:acylphosphatase